MIKSVWNNCCYAIKQIIPLTSMQLKDAYYTYHNSVWFWFFEGYAYKRNILLSSIQLSGLHCISQLLFHYYIAAQLNCNFGGVRKILASSIWSLFM